MNHHPAYPTRAAERAESRADDILSRQRASEDAWQKLIARTIEDANRIEFPIAFPCPGYDHKTAIDLLWDFMVIKPSKDEELRAIEIAEGEAA